MPDKFGNEMFDHSFRFAPIAMAMLGVQGEWIKVNPAFTQMTGFSIEELFAKKYMDLIHPDDLARDEEHRKQLLNKETECCVLEKRCINKQGHIMWVTFTSSLVFDDEGEPRYYIVQAQDITERKQQEWSLKSSEEHYRSLLDYAPDPLAVYCDGLIVYTNHAGARLSGVNSPSEIIGKEIFHFLHPDYYEIAEKVIGEIVRTGKPINDVEVKMLRLNGEPIDLIVSSAPTTFLKKPAIHFSIRDITKRKTLEEMLLHSQQRLRGIFNMAGVGIALMDFATRKHIDCNPALEIFLGYSKKEIENFTFVEVSHFDDIDRDSILFSKLEAGEIDSFQIEKRYIRKDGEEVWGVLTVSILEEGSPYAIAIIHDVTETKLMEQKLIEANEKLLKLSYLDGLTGIYNRRFFDSTIEREWGMAIANRTPLSLIFFDIDHFKNYNDYYGHQSGDECLQQVAQTARTLLDGADHICARYGGEEFMMILPRTDLLGARDIAEKIRKAVEELRIPHQQSSTGNFITVSLGVATMVPSSEMSYDDLILEADCALYKAKQGNRNCVETFQ